ncbi:hypothetical protein BDZ94DRAFT_1256766 [Collybia nuda]|uniref:Uncharacterized protein n=1 Tax=Collybia nuda TaxID=64659 RepID=A0A9P6CKW9_9AGAR|nr:hypothetical protein BDZ94DRAFT_1256766 [Collybia nuda]
MSISQIILENATYHSLLLDSIAQLDHIPEALAQQNNHVEEGELNYKRGEAKLRTLSKMARGKREEYEDIRDSVIRRLTHTLTGRKGRFERGRVKKEGEYIEALERELTKSDSQKALFQLLTEAKEVSADLTSKAVRLESLRKELTDLYDQIFNGPTAEFPEDDRLETHVEVSQGLCDHIQRTLESERQAGNILEKADRTMLECRGRIQKALGHSEYHMWVGGDNSTRKKRKALSAAQTLARQVETLCLRAQTVSPLVQPIGPLYIAQRSYISDMFFDNIFSSITFHGKIKNSIADLARLHTRLKVQKDAATHRADVANSQLIAESRSLGEYRKALYDLRHETFQRIVSGRGIIPAERPPSYYSPEIL